MKRKKKLAKRRPPPQTENGVRYIVAALRTKVANLKSDVSRLEKTQAQMIDGIDAVIGGDFKAYLEQRKQGGN